MTDGQKLINLLEEALTMLKAIEARNPNPTQDTPLKVLEWRQFSDWALDGYRIIRGSKATKRNGVNMFSSEQVVKQSELKPKEDFTNKSFYMEDIDDPF